ncbi:MAG TPA: hypothetical protein VGR50_07565 [Terriglobales bacterium]|nr:hypothetical protein [Terriglobales bacterium]
MAGALWGMVVGMTLSLGIALVMERMLFRGLLKLMLRAPAMVRRNLAVAKPSLQSIREAGL